ncbi:glutamyl-tRNA amidotransferase [Colletotrichum incanum]|nr:glutamyl-tRNA amidotransferase [Colletotrichum incanum]
MRVLLLIAGAFLHYQHVGAHIFLQTGTTIQLNNIGYFVPPEPIGTIHNATINIPAELSLFPVTVVNSDTTSSSPEGIDGLLNHFSKIDDVFQDGFRQAVYVQHTNGGSSGGHAEFSHLGSSRIYWSHFTNASNSIIPDGPYFVSRSGLLYQAYRLYADLQGAFSETVIANAEGFHTVLPANIPGQSLAVAVPSRLYYRQTAEKPLAGLRLGVKDIYDVQGLKTSNGNRAWYHLYPSMNRTATVVQNLMDAGAVLVGKMKTSQFANGESATADWVDYHAPFNPRGDGYQDPSSSSAGPAAGIAAYEWLDIALGSDTGGSIRSPSQVQGIYGNRPSHDLVSLDGAMPLAPEFDTAGLLARDPSVWIQATKALYGHNMTFTSSYPTKILTIGFPGDDTSEFNTILQHFLTNLTEFLSASTTPFELTESWTRMNPDQPSLLSFINNTYEVLSAKEQARLVRDKFYADYAASNDGRLPHVNPAPLQRWALGDASSSAIMDDLKNKTRFMNWFNEKILYHDSQYCSNSLLIYVPRTPKETSRDTYMTAPQTPKAFSTSRISVMSGVPDIVVPIGQLAYFSSVTNHTEYLPVTVDLMAAKGCDGMLFSLVEDLYKVGLIKASQPGQSYVSGGKILS